MLQGEQAKTAKTPEPLSHCRAQGACSRMLGGGSGAGEGMTGDKMTENEWLEGSDPEEMLVGLTEFQPSDRKVRLFMCACCRLIWQLFSDDRCRKAVEVAERYADGLASEDERQEADEAAATAADDGEEGEDLPYFDRLALEGCGNAASLALSANEGESTTSEAQLVAEWTVFAATGSKALDDQKQEAKRLAMFGELVRSQCDLLRDTFGNPFRPVTIDRSLQTPAVVKLAQQIYDQRAFDRLPKLADALKKAGCDNQELLAHCREKGLHERGCWVVDLLLGKE